MSTRAKYSFVWKFFSPKNDGNSIATCNMCQRELSYKSSSNNLKKHLQRKHPVELKKFSSKTTKRDFRSASPLIETPSTSRSKVVVKVESSTNCNDSGCHSSLNEAVEDVIFGEHTETKMSDYLQEETGILNKKEIDDQLMLFIIKDFQPFSIVEDVEFKGFSAALNAEYQFPSIEELQLMSQTAYEDAYIKTKVQLKKAKAVTLSTDCWTSRDAENFVSVTAHYITKDFQLKNVLLDCILLGEDTSENLARELTIVFNEWNIENKILMIISDNAANTYKAIKEDLQLKHFGCYAHSMDLIVKNSLKPITPILEKVKAIIAHLKGSRFAAENFKMLQDNPTKLIQDVYKRWNSTFYMLERFIFLERPIKMTIPLLKQNLPIISSEEWKFLKEIVRILKPMETFTNFISEQNYLTASSVIILTDGLRNVYENLKLQNFMPDAQKLINSIISELKNRLGEFESENALTLATFLDPRYKRFGFSKNEVFEVVKSDVISQITDLIINKSDDTEESEQPQETDPTNTSDADSIWKDFDDEVAQSTKFIKIECDYTEESEEPEENDFKRTSEDISIWEHFEQRKNTFQPSETAQSKAIIEVKRYLDEPPIPRTQDPLTWWKISAHNFPNLATIVKKNMVACATSVSCEAFFSKSGQSLSEKRCLLSSSNAKKILFLNSNM